MASIVVIVDGIEEHAAGDAGLIQHLVDWASVNGYEYVTTLEMD